MDTPDNGAPGNNPDQSPSQSQPRTPSQDEEQRRRGAQDKPGEQPDRHPGREEQEPKRKGGIDPESGDEDDGTTPGA